MVNELFITDISELKLPRKDADEIRINTDGQRLFSLERSEIANYVRTLSEMGYTASAMQPEFTLFRRTKITSQKANGIPKISIIIGGYNYSRFIWRFMEAFFAQEVDLNKFEIIVVDDCSTDDSEEQISKWKNLLWNLRFFKLPENTGSPIEPRNRGIKEANGDYIFFHDADDYLLPGALKEVIAFLEKEEPDVLYPRLVGDNGRNVPRSQFEKGTVLRAEFLHNNLSWNLNPIKFFKRELVNQFDIKFKSEAPMFEDHVFVMHALLYANKISILDGDGIYAATYHEGAHLSRDNWKMDVDVLYIAVDIILSMIKRRFYMSAIQIARWSTAVLRRHLKQLSEHSKTYGEERTIAMIGSLQPVVKKYADYSWISFFPKSYHAIFSLLLNDEPQQIYSTMLSAKLMETTQLLEADFLYNHVKWLDTSPNTALITLDDKAPYYREKGLLIDIGTLGWDSFGFPTLSYENDVYPISLSDIKLNAKLAMPSKILGELKKANTHKLVAFEGAAIHSDGADKLIQDIRPDLAGIPLDVKSIVIETKNRIILKIDDAEVVYNPEKMIFARLDIDNYLTSISGDVLTIKQIAVYSSTNFSKETHLGIEYGAGKRLKVREIVYTKGGTPRIQIDEGYVSANKLFVKKIKSPFSKKKNVSVSL